MNYLLLTTTIFGFLFGLFKKPDPIHIQLSDQISVPFAKRMAKKYGMKGSGGGGAFIDTVNKVSIFFDTNRAISLDECRQEYVDMITEMLYLYNHNEEIRPYLGTYPFTAKNISIFTIYNDDPRICIKDRVFTANVLYGTINFRIKNIKSANDEVYHRETFEEAYFKVHGKAWEP